MKPISYDDIFVIESRQYHLGPSLFHSFGTKTPLEIVVLWPSNIRGYKSFSWRHLWLMAKLFYAINSAYKKKYVISGCLSCKISRIPVRFCCKCCYKNLNCTEMVYSMKLLTILTTKSQICVQNSVA